MNIEELIKQEKYQEALSLLVNDESIDSLYYKSLILFKMGKFQASLSNAEKGLLTDQRYYDFLKIKIEDMLALGFKKDVLRILDEEFKMPYIPKEYDNYFKETYSQTVKELRAENKEFSPYDILNDDELSEELSNTVLEEEMIPLINQLSKRNVRNFIEDIKEILVRKDLNLVKSVLLEILYNQGYNQEISLVKNDLTFTLIPTSLTPFAQRPSTMKILQNLQVLNEGNVTIEETSFQVLVPYLADIYPLDLDDEEVKYVASAVYITSCMLLNTPVNIDYVTSKLDLSKSVLDVYLKLINKQ